jgi:hypothetical protein
MPRTLFFSWQSDTPASIGSEFIESALEAALASVSEDAQIEKAIRDEGLMVDRDTKGVTGVPPIVDTIFDKSTVPQSSCPTLPSSESAEMVGQPRTPTSSWSMDGR